MKTILEKVILALPSVRKLYNDCNALSDKLSEAYNKLHFKEEENIFLKEKIDKLEQKVEKKNLPVSILQDQFIAWIKSGVVGWCPDSNIEIIDNCMSFLPEGAVIEIGSFCGFSTSIIAHSLRRYKNKNNFFSVDDWIFEGYEDLMKHGGVISDAFTCDDWRDHTENMFKLTVKLTAKNINHSHIKLNSDRFFTAWENNNSVSDVHDKEKQLGGKIAFAYIDGDHSYEQSKKDFLNVDKFLVTRGYVFFDDSSDLVDFGCKDVANEVAKMPNYKLVSPESTKLNKCFVKIY